MKTKPRTTFSRIAKSDQSSGPAGTLTRIAKGCRFNLSRPSRQQNDRQTDNASRAECKQFSDAFGPQGLRWYAEGFSFAQAEAEMARLKRQTEQFRLRRRCEHGLSGRAPDARGCGESVRPPGGFVAA